MPKFTRHWLFQGLVLIILGVILDIILKTKITALILGYMWIGIKTAACWIVTANLKVWIVLIIVAVVIWLSRIYWKSRLSPKKPEPLPTRPKHTEYDGDIFETILWKWKWKFDKESNLYVPSKFTAYCPKCTCQLVPHESGGYDCPNCRKIYPYRDRDQEDQRLALISHNINIDSYPSTGHRVPPGFSKL